jgi:molecular chaperone HscB
MQAAHTTGRQCWKCKARIAAAFVCPYCEVIQHLPTGIDLFAVLGLPRSLRVDRADLERRYHEASRTVHPDRHQTGEERERALSLAASAALNRAYRTLRDPLARGRYWLELHGARLGENNNRVPAALAAEVFDVQEKLEELRSAAPGPERDAVEREVRALRADLDRRFRGMTAELEALYDTEAADHQDVLTELKRRLSEIAYLGSLLGDVDESLGEETLGPHHRH